MTCLLSEYAASLSQKLNIQTVNIFVKHYLYFENVVQIEIQSAEIMNTNFQSKSNIKIFANCAQTDEKKNV